MWMRFCPNPVSATWECTLGLGSHSAPFFLPVFQNQIKKICGFDGITENCGKNSILSRTCEQASRFAAHTNINCLWLTWHCGQSPMVQKPRADEAVATNGRMRLPYNCFSGNLVWLLAAVSFYACNHCIVWPWPIEAPDYVQTIGQLHLCVAPS